VASRATRQHSIGTRPFQAIEFLAATGGEARKRTVVSLGLPSIISKHLLGCCGIGDRGKAECKCG
jgi:hypothetical protein